MGTMPTMAYLVKRKNGSWEIRESRQTEAGPRARTLATFREPTFEVIRRALERSEQGLMERELRSRLREAGIPFPAAEADIFARELLGEIAEGRLPSPALRRLLLDAIGKAEQQAQETVPDWIFKSYEEKGRDLWDLLLLADSLPVPDLSHRPGFPRLKDLADERAIASA